MSDDTDSTNEEISVDGTTDRDAQPPDSHCEERSDVAIQSNTTSASETADDFSDYAQTKAELDTIVSEVRKKDVSLEKSLDLLEEGVRLANRCTELIDQAGWAEAEGFENESTAEGLENESTAEGLSDESAAENLEAESAAEGLEGEDSTEEETAGDDSDA